MTTYRETCNHRANMYGVRRVLDAFCDYVNRARDCGRITAEVAERQTDMAGEIEYAIDDRAATAETWVNYEKIRLFNRNHNLAY